MTSTRVDLLGEDVVRRVRWQKRGIERADIGEGVLYRQMSPSAPSELDKLDDCPFVFLARHRLKIRAVDLPDFEVSPLEIGILAHRILREFYAVPAGDSEEQASGKNAGGDRSASWRLWISTARARTP